MRKGITRPAWLDMPWLRTWHIITATVWLAGFIATAWGTFPASLVVVREQPRLVATAPWGLYVLRTGLLALLVLGATIPWRAYVTPALQAWRHQNAVNAPSTHKEK